ncbi:hypothetical protein KUCAC02_004471, partial [Chaenocephalus aceratus]
LYPDVDPELPVRQSVCSSHDTPLSDHIRHKQPEMKRYGDYRDKKPPSFEVNDFSGPGRRSRGQINAPQFPAPHVQSHLPDHSEKEQGAASETFLVLVNTFESSRLTDRKENRQMHGAAGMRRLGPELGTDPMPGSIHIWMSLSVENAPPSPPRPTPPPP